MSNDNKRLVGLDLLRLLAIVLVLGRHNGTPPPDLLPLWKSMLATWQRGGWVGVDLFFVLSGFLISGLLFSEYRSSGRISPLRFYARRGWKIYPPFFVLIAVTMLLALPSARLPAWSRLAAEVLFLQSYLPGIWNHTWSLAVEEHFYLMLPLLLLVILRWNRRSSTPLRPLLFVAICLASTTLLLRFFNWQVRTDYSHLTHLYPTHLRLDSLFFGVSISYLYHFHSKQFVERLTPWRWTLILAGVLLMTPAFKYQLETTPFVFTLGLSFFYLGSGLLLTGVLLSEIPRTPLVLFLARLGACSYSIYLWHMPVLQWFIPILEAVTRTRFGFEVRTILYVTGSLACGVLMARLVEVPALRLRDRWFPSRSDGATLAVSDSAGGSTIRTGSE